MNGDKNIGKSLRSQLREWLKEICPDGKVEDYCQVMTDSASPEVMKVRLFTHDFRYSIVVQEKAGYKHYLACMTTRRKTLAGLPHHTYADLFEGDFSHESWELIKNAILRFELVKLTAKAKVPIWKKMCSHYEHDGRQFYSEWLQRGKKVKENKVYELLGTQEEGVVKKPPLRDPISKQR